MLFIHNYILRGYIKYKKEYSCQDIKEIITLDYITPIINNPDKRPIRLESDLFNIQKFEIVNVKAGVVGKNVPKIPTKDIQQPKPSVKYDMEDFIGNLPKSYQCDLESIRESVKK